MLPSTRDIELIQHADSSWSWRVFDTVTDETIAESDGLQSLHAANIEAERIMAEENINQFIREQFISSDKLDLVLRLSELTDIVHSSPLPRPMSVETFAKLADVQGKMRNEHDLLVDRLDTGQLMTQAFLDEMTKLLCLNRDEMLEVLGDETFDAIFGEAGRHPERIIDQDIFLGLTPDSSSAPEADV